MISPIPLNKIKYIVIGDAILFKPHKNTLKDIASGKKGTLNNVTSQLLLYLLQNGKNTATRDEILLNVFQHNGARATDANLNQHISFLRKVITSIGHSAELIVTIPKVGFRISEERVNFQLFEDPPGVDSEPLTIAETSKSSSITETEIKKSKNYHGIKVTALITVTLIMVVFLYTWIQQTSQIPQASILNSVELQQCQFHILGNAYTDSISKEKAREIIKLVGVKPDCSTKKDIYINVWASNNDIFNWLFVAECGYNNGYYYCSSYYHHQEEWSEN